MEDMKFIGRNLMSREQLEHELASRENNRKYVQQEFQVDGKEGGASRIQWETKLKQCVVSGLKRVLKWRFKSLCLIFWVMRSHEVFFVSFCFRARGFLRGRGLSWEWNQQHQLNHFKLPSCYRSNPISPAGCWRGRRRKRRKGGPGLVGEVDWQQGFNFNGMFSRALPFPSWMGE